MLKNPSTKSTNVGPFRARSHSTLDIASPWSARSRKSENKPTMHDTRARNITLSTVQKLVFSKVRTLRKGFKPDLT